MRLLVIALCVVGLAACEQHVSNDKPVIDIANKQAATTMQVITLDQWADIRSSYQGKILVVDMWASWCASCIERFPAMVAMSQSFDNQAVQFISLNLDEPSDAEAIDWSNNFLRKMNAVFPNYHLRENMMLSFERLELLGIPVVVIYNQQGEQAYKLTGDNPNKQFSEDDVQLAIQSLLKS